MWKLTNYESCGRSHVETSTPCQDKTLSLSRNGVNVIALADGAGSAKFSHFGAETATRAVCEYVTEHFDALINSEDGVEVKRDVLAFLNTALTTKSAEIGCDFKALASTLLMVAIKSDRFLIMHLGDGVIGYLKDGSLRVASMPDNGEYINSTFFITSGNAVSAMRLYKGRLDNVSGFVLLSDGSADSFYQKRDKSLSSALTGIMHRSTLVSKEKMEALLKMTMDNVIVQNTRDDCSIAMMAKTSGQLPAYPELSCLDKQQVLGFHSSVKKVTKRVERCDVIFKMLDAPKTLRELKMDIKKASKTANSRRSRDVGLKQYHLIEALKLMKQSGLICSHSGRLMHPV